MTLPRARLLPLLAGLALVVSVSSAPASAAPRRAPDPVGSTPVATTPSVVGALRGENGGAMDSCRVGRRDVVVVAGDVDRYTAARRDRGVARVWIFDARSGKALGNVSVSGKTRRADGVRYDSGFVQSLYCRSGSRAKIYLGGSFTRVQGRERKRTAMVEVRMRRGTIKRSVRSWEVPSRYPVTSVSPGKGRTVLVASGGNVKSVGWSSGDVRWTVRSRCGGVATALYARGYVYVGGFFDGLRGTRGTSTRNHGLAKVGAESGKVVPRSRFRTSIPRNSSCSNFSGSNPGSIVHDAARKRIVTCEGGVKQNVRAVSRGSGRQAWVHELDGDGQVCLKVKKRIFVGFHRSKGNLVLDQRGCGMRNCGSQGAFFRLTDGRQTRWLPPSGDFAGGGRNRDGRNNGISGATLRAGWMYVSGGFDRVGSTRAEHVVRFRLL